MDNYDLLRVFYNQDSNGGSSSQDSEKNVDRTIRPGYNFDPNMTHLAILKEASRKSYLSYHRLVGPSQPRF